MKLRGTGESTKMFAPILIGIVFGLAILGSFPIFMPSSLRTSNAMSREITYEDCVAMPNSYIMENYPPTCVTAKGVSYTKSLPAVVTTPLRYQP